jgi:membrane protein insertase Oxa1/YidC/SpoIIIJ
MSPSGKPGGKAPRPFMDPGVAEATPSLYFSPLFFFFFFAPLPALLLLGSP